jgi:aspartate/methionine/tyrosine aminotransferase
MIEQSKRLAAVQTPVIPFVIRWIEETPGTISLGQGLVSYGPPQQALDALKRFPEAPDDHKYGPGEGLPEFVAALEAKLLRENQTRMTGRRLFVTAGGNLAFMNAVLAIADPGDEVILPVPFYFNHEMAIVMANCRPVPVRTQPNGQLDLDAIRAAVTPRTRAIVTVSPNNPTGAMYPEAALREVNALCAHHGIFHIHDEAYEYFTYDDQPHFSPASIAGSEPHTVALYSFSKAYGFASWRIGYMVIPEGLWDAVNKIQDTMLICAPTVSQRAALGALEAGRAYVRPHVAQLARTRHVLFNALNDPAVPCDVMHAQGAFFFFIRVHSSHTSMVVTERLVREHRVAVTPGSAFGATEGCYARVSFGALDHDTAAEGIGRLVEGLKHVS